jgi:hypothetical protein
MRLTLQLTFRRRIRSLSGEFGSICLLLCLLLTPLILSLNSDTWRLAIDRSQSTTLQLEENRETLSHLMVSQFHFDDCSPADTGGKEGSRVSCSFSSSRLISPKFIFSEMYFGHAWDWSGQPILSMVNFLQFFDFFFTVLYCGLELSVQFICL